MFHVHVIRAVYLRWISISWRETGQAKPSQTKPGQTLHSLILVQLIQPHFPLCNPPVSVCFCSGLIKLPTPPPTLEQIETVGGYCFSFSTLFQPVVVGTSLIVSLEFDTMWTPLGDWDRFVWWFYFYFYALPFHFCSILFYSAWTLNRALLIYVFVSFYLLS